MLPIKTALRQGKRFLSFLDNPSLESELLLADILQCSRTKLKTNNHQKLTHSQILKFLNYLLKRRLKIPFAYITKHKTWSDFEIEVNKHVLIPRDETEILCHHILEQNIKPASILDIGTGSGCISLFMAQHFPESQISALDISHKALKVAQKNAKTNHFKNIDFIKSDLLEICSQKDCYDLIIANLPYVPEKLNISAEVKCEPNQALFSGPDGLDHIKQLKQELKTKKIIFQQLWLEFLPSQQKSIKEIFKNYKIQFFPDLENKIFFALICSSSRTPQQR